MPRVSQLLRKERLRTLSTAEQKPVCELEPAAIVTQESRIQVGFSVIAVVSYCVGAFVKEAATNGVTAPESSKPSRPFRMRVCIHTSGLWSRLRGVDR